MNDLKQRLADAVKCTDDPAYPMWIMNLLRDALAVIEQQEKQIAELTQFTIDQKIEFGKALMGSRSHSDVAQLESQLREREAQCAAMRHELESLKIPPYKGMQALWSMLTAEERERIDQALSTDAGKAMLERLQKAEAELLAIQQEEVRRIRHLNRLGTWAQQDATGPIIKDQIQAWVLAELKAALGSAYEPTSWQPETAIAEQDRLQAGGLR